MPSYLRGLDHSLLRFVRLDAAKPLFYGWKTKDFSGIVGVSESDVTLLGHQTFAQMSAISGAIAVIGANTPKPARVRKVLNRRPSASEQGSVSSFVSGAALTGWDVLLEAGWEVVESVKRVTITDNARFQTVGANCSNGGIYCFPLSKTTPQTVIDELLLIPAAELRLEANQKKCFAGASKPRPPKVKKAGIASPSGSYDAHTFCSVDAYENALQTGWLPVKGEIPYFGTPVTP